MKRKTTKEQLKGKRLHYSHILFLFAGIITGFLFSLIYVPYLTNDFQYECLYCEEEGFMFIPLDSFEIDEDLSEYTIESDNASLWDMKFKDENIVNLTIIEDIRVKLDFNIYPFLQENNTIGDLKLMINMNINTSGTIDFFYIKNPSETIEIIDNSDIVQNEFHNYTFDLISKHFEYDNISSLIEQSLMNYGTISLGFQIEGNNFSLLIDSIILRVFSDKIDCKFLETFFH